jgi:hypothetical protein
MSGKEIEDKLMRAYNEMVNMRYAFGNIEEMVDCDEPPKRGNDFSIKFVKNGEVYTCYVESKEWTRIYPKDLKPVIECIKSSDRERITMEMKKYDDIEDMVKKLNRQLNIYEDFI